MGETHNENKLGTMPCGRLLASMSIPMMISFFIQAMYNIIDSMFVAMLSENALTAVSLAFPIQQIVNAIGVGIAAGITALVPRYLGQGDGRTANQIANSGIFLNGTATLIFLVLGIFLPSTFYRMQTDVTEIVQGGTVYLTIVMCLSAGVLFGQYFEKMLVASGYARHAMYCQGAGAVFNIVFDPLLIFGLGPFPRMGIAGAAVATVVGQLLATVLAAWLNRKINRSIHFDIRQMRPAPECKEILKTGLPSMITIGLHSATTFVINQILLVYSTTATAVYGIWIRLQNFAYMPVFGMNNGMIPILSYNLGNKRPDRIHETTRLAFLWVLIFTVTEMILLELLPGGVLHLFSASETMLAIGIPAIRIVCISLPLGALSIIASASMQALRHPMDTLLLNVFRQFVVIVASFALLSAVFHRLNVLWAAVPITEVISVIIAWFLYRRTMQDVERSILHSNK